MYIYLYGELQSDKFMCEKFSINIDNLIDEVIDENSSAESDKHHFLLSTNIILTIICGLFGF